ncbi:MAG: glycosyltransferase, partial [Candidatus Heimdallarchaeota archaeon]|nr:glycosyltransferase [Candidatus Heimdallarchaeota archaeon]
VSKFEVIDGLEVYHPRFFYIPGVFKSLDGVFLFLSSLFIIVRIRCSFRFDVIDAHFAYPDGFAAVLLGKVFRVPVTVTLRGTNVPLSKFFFRRQFVRWTLHNVKKIFSVARFLKKITVALGIPGEKIVVVPNGVDNEKFQPLDRKESREKLQIPDDYKVIISIGGLTERKGFHRVIEVLPEIMSKLNDKKVIYIIIGGPSAEGDYSSALKKQISKLHLEHSVWMVGQKEHDELALWLSSANLFCLATRNEGCPNVLLEAMACGLPVVATDVGGISEIITSEKFAILVKFGNSDELRDAILEALRKDWDNGKIVEHVSRYSWEIVATQLISEYDKLFPQ